MLLTQVWLPCCPVFLRHIHRKLDRILYMLERSEQDFAIMSVSFDALTAQVAENTDVEQSAIVLLQAISEQLRNAAGDPAEVNALAARLKSSADSLAAAIVANTPPAVPT